MRVITGTCRGRRLLEPVGRDVRPTADQVKEAMFNIIQFDVEGRKVLDLFAGTGQLGIEALSRGAAECLFVDSARDSVRLVQENLRRCGLAARVLQCDALGILKSGEKFDLVILDPPAFCKSAAEIKDAYRGYKDVNLTAMKLVKSGGYLISCSCSHLSRRS